MLAALFGAVFYLQTLPPETPVKDRTVFFILAVYLGISPLHEQMDDLLDAFLRVFDAKAQFADPTSAFLTSAVGVPTIRLFVVLWEGFMERLKGMVHTNDDNDSKK